jgi:hypothetical protein
MQALMNNESDNGDAHLLKVLEADNLLKMQRQHYGRRQLSGRTLAVMWVLRIYAALMVIVVIYSVVLAIHPGS